MQTCDFSVSVITSWLSLDLHVGVGVFPLDCFWINASVKFLIVITVSFVCNTLT